MDEQIVLEQLSQEILAEIKRDCRLALIEDICRRFPVLRILPDSDFDNIVRAWMGPDGT